MAFNLSTIDEDRITFGPGVIYLGAAGTTPTTDIGAVEAAMTLTFKRTMMDLYQGSPKSLVKRVATQEDLTVEFTGLEVDLQNLQYALGAGEYTAGPPQVLELGGDMEFDDLAMRFIHQTAAGGTVTVDIWAVNGSGEAAMQFGDEWFKFPASFNAMESSTDWAGATLADKKKLFKITNEDPP
jgi:hypothetical protein